MSIIYCPLSLPYMSTGDMLGSKRVLVETCDTNQPNLKYLYLSNNFALDWNQYTDNTWIQHSKRLETFVEENCNLRKFPGDLVKLPNITEIYLNHNKLTYPDLSDFDQIKDSLQRISWTYNNWTCDCGMVPFVRYLQDPKLVNLLRDGSHFK